MSTMSKTSHLSLPSFKPCLKSTWTKGTPEFRVPALGNSGLGRLPMTRRGVNERPLQSVRSVAFIGRMCVISLVMRFMLVRYIVVIPYVADHICMPLYSSHTFIYMHADIGQKLAVVCCRGAVCELDCRPYSLARAAEG